MSRWNGTSIKFIVFALFWASTLGAVFFYIMAEEREQTAHQGKLEQMMAETQKIYAKVRERADRNEAVLKQNEQLVEENGRMLKQNSEMLQVILERRELFLRMEKDIAEILKRLEKP